MEGKELLEEFHQACKAAGGNINTDGDEVSCETPNGEKIEIDVGPIKRIDKRKMLDLLSEKR